LGIAYFVGSGGLERDRKEAFRLFSLAAQRDNPDAHDWLGYYYCYSFDAVEIDIDAALLHFRRSAAQGNAAGMRDLAQCYALGRGVERNLEKALKWYNRSSALHDEFAIRTLKLIKDRIDEQYRPEVEEILRNLSLEDDGRGSFASSSSTQLSNLTQQKDEEEGKKE